MSRLLRIAATGALAFVSAAAYADRGAEQAKAFMNIYAMCLTHVADFDKLRAKLAPVRKLPPDKAAIFLFDRPGDAWPVLDHSGYFVLSLFRDRNACAVHARETDTEMVKAQFRQLTASAPTPFKSAEISKDSQHGGDRTEEPFFTNGIKSRQRGRLCLASRRIHQRTRNAGFRDCGMNAEKDSLEGRQ